MGKNEENEEMTKVEKPKLPKENLVPVLFTLFNSHSQFPIDP